MRSSFLARGSFSLGVLLGCAVAGCSGTHTRADDGGAPPLVMPDADVPIAPDAWVPPVPDAGPPRDCVVPLAIARGSDVHASGLAWNEDRFLAAWSEGGTRGMVQVLDARGAPLSSPRELPPFWGGALAVGRGFVVFLETGVQRLSMDGAPIGGPIPLADTYYASPGASYVEGSRLLLRLGSFGGGEMLVRIDVEARDPSVEIVREVPSEWLLVGVAADRVLELRRHEPFLLREVPLDARAEPSARWESTLPEGVSPLFASYDARGDVWEVMVQRHVVEEGFGSYSAPGALRIDGEGEITERLPVEGRPLRTVTGSVARSDTQTALAYWDFHSDALLWVLDHDGGEPTMQLPLEGLAASPYVEVDHAHGGFAVLSSRGEPHSPHEVVELRCGLGSTR